VLALAACALTACGGDEGVAPSPPPTLLSLESEGASLQADLDGIFTLRVGDRAVLSLPLDAFVIGTVGALDEGRAYDPRAVFGDDPLGKAPADLAWHAPIAIELAAERDGAAELALDYGAGLVARLFVKVAGPRRFSLAWTAESTGTEADGRSAAVAYYRFGATIDPAEGLYGLGEQLDHVNQRGYRRAMQLALDPATESRNNEAHVPVPLLLGTTGWGFFVDSDLIGVVDAAKEAPDRVEAVFRSDPNPKAPFVVELFAEEAPLDLVGQYWAITGAPKTPAPWVLGPLYWRDENVDQAEVERDLDALRDLDIAATGFWIDRPYATAVNTFDFHAEQFPDPEAMLAKASALGFRTGLWHVPYLDESEEVTATAALRAEAEAGGFYPPTTSILLNGWGKPIDFTNPAAVAFWKRNLEPYRDLGIAGYKLDYAEDIVPALADARSIWTFADGSDERTMHARYNRLYHEVYAAMIPDGGLLLCRHANPGGQTLGIVVWPGDLDATFARAGDPASDGDEDYVSVGGLPASVVAGLSLSASGFPFYGADTGGYRHSPPDPELWIRWIEQTSLSTVMQVGNGASTVPWEGDPRVEGVAVVDVLREYARLHLRLAPYLWTWAARMTTDGRPIQRPLGLAYPSLGVHPDDTYLLGPDLLVAPVLDRGVRSRDVQIPEGGWIDWWTGARIDGPAVVHADAPLGRLPLYVRAGALVPMLGPAIDALEPTTEPERVESHGNGARDLWWRGGPGEGGSEAPGEPWSEAFDGSRARFTTSDTGFEVDLVAGSGGAPTTGLELWAGAITPALAVTVDGAPLAETTVEAVAAGAIGWATDAVGGAEGSRALIIRVASTAHKVRVQR
jgi:alpha-D-xyloside xylohydrolase